MKERDVEEQLMAEKKKKYVKQWKWNIFLPPSVNTIAVSKVLKRD